MAVGRVSGVAIAGIYAGVPVQVVENASMTAAAPAAELQKIIKSIGIERRRVAPREQCTSDLAHAAADRLLSDLAWDRDSIDLLVFVSQTPDYPLPATACMLQQRLGLRKIARLSTSVLDARIRVWDVGRQSASQQPRRGRALLLVGDTSTWNLARTTGRYNSFSAMPRQLRPLNAGRGGGRPLSSVPTAPGHRIHHSGGGARNKLDSASFTRRLGEMDIHAVPVMSSWTARRCSTSLYARCLVS